MSTESNDNLSDERRDPEPEGSAPGPREEADERTKEDAGLVGGTGAAPTEGTAQPSGTEQNKDGDEEA